MQEIDLQKKLAIGCIQSNVSNNNNFNYKEFSKKQVRFEPHFVSSSGVQSLPVIQENQTFQTNNSPRSLPQYLLTNPTESRMELSLCDATMKQQQFEQQQQRAMDGQKGANMKPLFTGLYEKADVTHLMHQTAQPLTIHTEVQKIRQSLGQNCKCQYHTSGGIAILNQNPVISSSLPQSLMITAAPVPQQNTDSLKVQSLENQIRLMQTQISAMEHQIAYLMSCIPMQSPVNILPTNNHDYTQKNKEFESPMYNKSSNPFLSDLNLNFDGESKTESPKAYSDTGIQCTICEQEPSLNRSDQTFFNQVLGRVNNILDYNPEDKTHFDSHACKFIDDSDVSAESIPKLFEKDSDVKKSVDKSAFVDALAAKYLTKPHYKPHDDGKPRIDVSKTCYNYLQKYDLLKDYSTDQEQNNLGNVLDNDLMVTSKKHLMNKTKF